MEYQDIDIPMLIVSKAIGKVRTAIPGRVLAYDAATQTATVQPSVRVWRVDEDDELSSALPTSISNCPVLFPAGGGVEITWPLVEGDVVTLLVADRSIDEWMATAGADVTPRSTQRFRLQDTLVLPGLRPSSAPLTGASTDGLQIATNGATIRAKDAGTFAVENASGELVALLVELIDGLLNGAITTPAGPGAFSPAVIAALTPVLANLQTFQE